MLNQLAKLLYFTVIKPLLLDMGPSDNLHNPYYSQTGNVGLEMQTNLSVCMWNVGGMMGGNTNYSKITDPWFIDIVQGNDIIALVETHMSPDQPIVMEGYHTLRRDRPRSNNGRHFGGWAVLIKEQIWKPGIKVLEQTLDYVWLKICKEPFDQANDIYIYVLGLHTTK